MDSEKYCRITQLDPLASFLSYGCITVTVWGHAIHNILSLFWDEKHQAKQKKWEFATKTVSYLATPS